MTSLRDDQDFRDYLRQLERERGLLAGMLPSVFEIEANWSPTAVSKAGAMGIGQFMPETAKRFNLKDRTDARESARASADYLKVLMDEFKDPVLAVGAYNAGEGAMRKFQAGTTPVYKETAGHMEKFKKKFAKYHGEEMGRQPLENLNFNVAALENDLGTRQDQTAGILDVPLAAAPESMASRGILDSAPAKQGWRPNWDRIGVGLAGLSAIRRGQDPIKSMALAEQMMLERNAAPEAYVDYKQGDDGLWYGITPSGQMVLLPGQEGILSSKPPETRTRKMMRNGQVVEVQEEWKGGKWTATGDAVPAYAPETKRMVAVEPDGKQVFIGVTRDNQIVEMETGQPYQPPEGTQYANVPQITGTAGEVLDLPASTQEQLVREQTSVQSIKANLEDVMRELNKPGIQAGALSGLINGLHTVADIMDTMIGSELGTVSRDALGDPRRATQLARTTLKNVANVFVDPTSRLSDKDVELANQILAIIDFASERQIRESLTTLMDIMTRNQQKLRENLELAQQQGATATIQPAIPSSPGLPSPSGILAPLPRGTATSIQDVDDILKRARQMRPGP